MLQAGVGCLPLDQAGEFLEPSQLGLVGGDHLPLPSLLLPVHGVHPVEVGGKEGGLLPPYPGADLQKHVLPFHRVFGAEEGAEGGLQPGQLLLGLGLLGLGQGPVLRVLQEFFQPCQVLLNLFILLPGLHQGSQILLLPVKFGHQVRVGVGLRLGQLGLHLLEAEGCLTQLRCQGRHQACPSPSWALAFSACSSASRRW